MAWDVQFKKGVWLRQIGWWLDAQQGAPRSFVSHAHSDHIARHREALCTPATARLMQSRLGGKRSFTTLAYRTPHPLELGCEVQLLPAGHILGSAQFLARHEHGTLLYTGDFKLGANAAAEPCELPRANVLIMETTFGLPRYVMPPAAQIKAEIVSFCRQALDGESHPCCTPTRWASHRNCSCCSAAPGCRSCSRRKRGRSPGFMGSWAGRCRPTRNSNRSAMPVTS